MLVIQSFIQELRLLSVELSPSCLLSARNLISWYDMTQHLFPSLVLSSNVLICSTFLPFTLLTLTLPVKSGENVMKNTRYENDTNFCPAAIASNNRLTFPECVSNIRCRTQQVHK